MRIILIITILLVFVIVITSYLLVNNRKLSPVQHETVTANCLGCHGGVPTYDAAIKVHNKHAAFDCGLCHSDVSGLQVADTAHTSLEWLAIGTMLFVLAGVAINIFVINRKGKVN